MKDELISRRETITAFWKSEVEFRPSQIDEVERVIKSIPARETVEELRQPKKIAMLVNPNPCGECSNCSELIDIRDGFKYCPGCGARLYGVTFKK